MMMLTLVLVVVLMLMVVAMVLMTMLVVLMVVVLLLMVVAMMMILPMLTMVVVVVVVVVGKLIMMMRFVNEVCLLPALHRTLYMFLTRRAECVWVLPILLPVWTAPALKDAEYTSSLCVHRKQLSCLPLQLLVRYMFRLNTVKLKQNLWMDIVSHLLSADMVCSDFAVQRFMTVSPIYNA